MYTVGCNIAFTKTAVERPLLLPFSKNVSAMQACACARARVRECVRVCAGERERHRQEEKRFSAVSTMVSHISSPLFPFFLSSSLPDPDVEDLEQEDCDEGLVPWALGWIHAATNFVLARKKMNLGDRQK